MFTKKDFNKYFDDLYEIEKIMEKDAVALLSILKDKRAQKILKRIVADEKRHAKIVLGLKKLL